MLGRVRRWVPLVLFFGLGFAWLLSSPPGSGPDENSHFIKTVGVGRGDLTGDDIPAGTPQPDFAPAQWELVDNLGGVFHNPGDLPAPNVCNAFQPTMPFDCAQPPAVSGTIAQRSVHGHYLPVAYVVPGFLTLGSSSTHRAMLLGRLGFLLENTALVAIAIAALAGARTRLSSSSAGLLVLSATPLLLYQSGTLAPNATETLSLVAFVCALVASARLESRRWWWIAAIVGSFAAWTRDLGFPCLLLFLPAVGIAIPGSVHWARSRLRGRDAIAVGLLAVSGAGSVLWQLILKESPHPRWHGFTQLWSDLGLVPRMGLDSIGLLGWLDVPMDSFLESAWAVAWIVCLVALLVRASRRQRLAAAYLGLAYVVLNLALISGFREQGFADQPRYALSLLIVLAILVAEGDRGTGTTWWFRVCCAIAAAGHFSTLIQMAHRQANGLGTPIDFAHVAWAPSGGWTLVVTLMVLVSVAVAFLPGQRLPASGPADASAPYN